MTQHELYQAYRQLSDHTYLDNILEQEKIKIITVYVIMNQINANPEHIKIEGVYLDEDRARNIAQDLKFAWVDEYNLTV